MPSAQLSIVVAPHPDDEVLGCCALMRRMLAEGRRVELVMMTGGGKSLADYCDLSEEEVVSERRRLTRNAAAVYGLPEDHIHFLDYHDGNIHPEPGETRRLADLLRRITEGQEDVAVFYPHRQGEGWPDHETTSHIVAKICGEVCPQALQYEYCVWFWFYNCWKIDWTQAHVLRMSRGEHEVKIKAIRAYVEPEAPCGKPWSGVLPKVFLWANEWNKELYFRVR